MVVRNRNTSRTRGVRSRIAPAAAALAVGLAVLGATAGTAGAQSGPRTYTVRPGDSVHLVAQRNGVSPDDVRFANGIIGDRLFAGGKLVIDPSAASTWDSGPIPARGAARPSPAPVPAPAPAAPGGGTYTVRPGDSLWLIAQRNRVGLDALLRANGLRANSLILPGRRLVIPGRGAVTPTQPISATRPAQPAPAPGGLARIAMVCPVPGARYTNDWGFPRGNGTGFHQGNDLMAPKGTTIVAPVSGTLTFGSNPLGGTTFNITTRDGWVVYGAHMSATIGGNRQVTAGQVIGRVGDSGDARGGPPHLHLGLRRTVGSFINPYPSLVGAC
ncbi:MAG: LysM peptidoglycan-binding domain-containing protein [Microthrixaceae bacterium]